MANEIFTRIQLKYDSYNAWTTAPGKDVVLFAGELGIAKLVNNVTIPLDSETNAPVLFKVGDGVHTFEQLPWASALAADVHAWAKATEAEHKEWLKTNHADNNTTYTFAIVEGALQVTETPHVNGVAGTPVVTSYDFVTPAELTEILKDYYTKDEIDNLLEGINDKIDDIDTGVHSVTLASGTNAGTLKLTVDGTPQDNVAVTGLKALAFKDSLSKSDVGLGNVDNTADANKPVSEAQAQAIADALAEAKTYADDNDANSAHTHRVGEGLKQTGTGGIAGEVLTELNLKFVDDADNKLLKLVDATSEAVIASFETDEFITDGMLQKVEADVENNKLIFTWNVDNAEGKMVTEIPLDAIADIYTGATNTETITTVKNTNEIEVTLVNKGITEAKLADEVTEKLNKAWQPIGDYKTKQKAVEDQRLTGAQVFMGIPQDENGVVSPSVRELTPVDIGAKAVQTPVGANASGNGITFIDTIAQDAQGVITVTTKEVAFPAAPKGTGDVAVATKNEDGSVTLNGSIKLDDHTLADGANADVTLHKVATTGNIADLEQTAGTYVIFSCGTATTVI